MLFIVNVFRLNYCFVTSLEKKQYKGVRANVWEKIFHLYYILFEYLKIINLTIKYIIIIEHIKQ